MKKKQTLLDKIKALAPPREPVDLGDAATCGECGKSLCPCPLRLPDGTWDLEKDRGSDKYKP